MNTTNNICTGCDSACANPTCDTCSRPSTSLIPQRGYEGTTACICKQCNDGITASIQTEAVLTAFKEDNADLRAELVAVRSRLAAAEAAMHKVGYALCVDCNRTFKGAPGRCEKCQAAWDQWADEHAHEVCAEL